MGAARLHASHHVSSTVTASAVPLATIILILSCVIALGAVVVRWRRDRTLLRFPQLFMLMFVVVYPLSGLVHILRTDNGSRGFFDMLTAQSGGVLISMSLLMLLVAALMAAIICAVGRSASPSSSRKSETSWYWASSTMTMLLVAPFSIYAIFRLSAYASTIESGRVVALTGGLARFSYLSNWLTWVVTVIAVALIFRRGIESSTNRVLVVLASLVVIAAGLAWTGGRSIIVLMCLPLIVITWPRLGRARWSLAPIALIMLAIAFAQIAEDRGIQSSSISSVETFIDWQWGRFSMLGFADELVRGIGPLNGESYLAALMTVPAAILGFIGVNISAGRTMSSFTGQYLLGDPSQKYVVSGALPEAYANFGPIGVLIVAALLALAVRWVDRRMALSAGPVQGLVYAYLGTLITLRTLSADSEAIFSYFFLSGAPLLIVGALSLIGPQPRSMRTSGMKATVIAKAAP